MPTQNGCSFSAHSRILIVIILLDGTPKKITLPWIYLPCFPLGSTLEGRKEGIPSRLEEPMFERSPLEYPPFLKAASYLQKKLSPFVKYVKVYPFTLKTPVEIYLKLMKLLS